VKQRRPPRAGGYVGWEDPEGAGLVFCPCCVHTHVGAAGEAHAQELLADGVHAAGTITLPQYITVPGLSILASHPTNNTRPCVLNRHVSSPRAQDSKKCVHCDHEMPQGRLHQLHSSVGSSHRRNGDGTSPPLVEAAAPATASASSRVGHHRTHPSACVHISPSQGERRCAQHAVIAHDREGEA
jgi:hypothetical protein